MSKIEIHAPGPNDAAAITAIDTAGLALGHASFRDQPHDWARFSAAYLTGRGLARIAVDDTGVVGWAGVSPTSAREVYQGVGEVSIYIAPANHGKGVGRHLLHALISASEDAGFWTLVSQIFPENYGSLSLHRNAGFKVLGTREKLGKMPYGPRAGQWRDVVMLERRSQHAP